MARAISLPVQFTHGNDMNQALTSYSIASPHPGRAEMCTRFAAFVPPPSSTQSLSTRERHLRLTRFASDQCRVTRADLA